MRKAKLRMLIVFCLIAFFPAGCGGDSQQQPAQVMTGMMKGQQAPDFTLKDLEGREFKLSSFKGNSVVCLVFWATWCPYCLKEIPKLKALHAQYDKKGLKIISVDIAANDPIQRVQAFRDKAQINYPILYDRQNVVSRLYGVIGVPVSVIIDRKGLIKYRGYTLPEKVEHLFNKLLQD